MMRPDHGLGGMGGASQMQLPPLPLHTDGLRGVPPTAQQQSVTNSAASMDWTTSTLPGNICNVCLLHTHPFRVCRYTPSSNMRT